MERSELFLTDPIIEKYTGVSCVITRDALGTDLEGKLVDASENWVEIETKRGIELINKEVVQNIKIVEDK